MIIQNGVLRVEVGGSGSVYFDPVTGYPDVLETGWSEPPMACQVVPLSMDYLMRAEADGSPLTGAEYQVLVDAGRWNLGKRPARVQIVCDELGLLRAERGVKSIRPLDAVGQVELIV